MVAGRARSTIYAVAERAGVSISTVSLAINHPSRVSEATRRRVLDAARAEGYRAPARATGRGRSTPRMIAVAAPFTAWPTYFERLSGVLERCAAAGVDVTVHDLPAANRSTAPILDALPVRDDIDGIIVMGLPLSAEAEALLAASGPATVVVDAESELPSVIVDDEHAGFLIGSHLASLGHRRVLFAHEQQVSLDYVSAGMLRFAGIRRGVEAAGGTIDDWLLADAAGLADRIRETGATAVAASNDDIAATVLGQLRASGISVPGDVSLTGCDGGRLADTLGLTTVVQPFVETGQTAASLLLSLIDGESPSVRRLVLGTRLRAGGTSAAIAPAD